MLNAKYNILHLNYCAFEHNGVVRLGLSSGDICLINLSNLKFLLSCLFPSFNPPLPLHTLLESKDFVSFIHFPFPKTRIWWQQWMNDSPRKWDFFWNSTYSPQWVLEELPGNSPNGYTGECDIVWRLVLSKSHVERWPPAGGVWVMGFLMNGLEPSLW